MSLDRAAHKKEFLEGFSSDYFTLLSPRSGLCAIRDFQQVLQCL